MDMKQLAKAVEADVIAIQRDLHRHPEISMEEERTIGVVTRELEKLDIPYEIVPHGGVIGFIKGERPGKSIILRADLDALPMTEAPTNLKQEKRVVSEHADAAHMCGHDGHTAMLLGAAKILAGLKNDINGKVILAFEQGEENGKGIYRLLQRLVEIGADGIWGIHLKNDIPTGNISVEAGPRMAGVFPFDVEIKGKSGHGSRPDLATSPIACFVDFYKALDAARLRSLNPFEPIAYSVGSLHSGSAPNVIPENLRFSGTARFLHEQQGEEAVNVFTRLLNDVCRQHNCTYEFIEKPVPIHLFVHNEETCSEIATNAVEQALGSEALIECDPWMASEPFGLYQKYFPGVFAFLGIENKEKGTGAEHHNAHFDIDEDALHLGVAATAQYALDFLKSDKEIPHEKETRDVRTLFQDLNVTIHER